MTPRRAPAIIAVAVGLLAVGCGVDAGGSDGRVPVEVLDATVVYFDSDGIEERAAEAPGGAITDADELATFARRYVDGEPALGSAASDALERGEVLIGGVVSQGCFAAAGAQLALVDGEVRMLPVGLPDDDHDVACARAITSVALVAIDPADLPAGTTVQGS